MKHRSWRNIFQLYTKRILAQSRGVYTFSVLVAILAILAVGAAYFAAQPPFRQVFIWYFIALILIFVLLALVNLYFVYRTKQRIWVPITNVLAVGALYIFLIKFFEYGSRLSTTDFYLVKIVLLFLFLMAFFSHIYFDSGIKRPLDLIVIVLAYFGYNHFFLSRVKIPTYLEFNFFDLLIFDIISSLILIVIAVGYGYFIIIRTKYEKRLLAYNRRVKDLLKLVNQRRRVYSDNIKAASHFHANFLSDDKILAQNFDYFLIYRPSMIISGDFYFFAQVGKNLVIIVGDSIGHGLSASMISLYVMSTLRFIINYFKPDNPAKVFELFISSANLTFDIDIELGIFYYNTETKSLDYMVYGLKSFIVTKGQVKSLDKNSRSICFKQINEQIDTKVHHLQLQTGDMLYIMTDGIVDLYRLSNRNKPLPRSFKKLLLKLSKCKTSVQKKFFYYVIKRTAAKSVPLDDITILGLKVL